MQPSAYKSAADIAADESFQDYVLGKPSSKWENFVTENPEYKFMVEEAKQLITAFNPIQTSIPVFPTGNKVAKKRSTVGVLAGILLVALIVGLCGYAFLDKAVVDKVLGKTEAKMTYAAIDQKRTEVLSDGSKIILKAGSQFSLLGDWKETRNIELEGDAIFDIVTNADSPLTVRTTEGLIQVLGTNFTVQSKNEFVLVLHDGKVKFTDKSNRDYDLSPDQNLIKNGDEFLITEVKSDYYTYWANEKLTFDNVPMAEIVEILKLSYDIEVKVENKSLLTKSINASVPSNDPELMLEAIATIYDIQLTNQGERFILR